MPNTFPSALSPNPGAQGAMFPFDNATYDAVATQRSSASLAVISARVVEVALAAPVPTGQTKRRLWTQEEMDSLAIAYARGTSVEELAGQLCRTKGAIRAKAHRLGLRRPGQSTRVDAGPGLLFAAAPPSRPDIKLERRANGRIIWTNDPVREIADLWKKGFSHRLIAELASCSAAAIRSVANTRGMACRSGFTLRKIYDANATELQGIGNEMVEQTCAQTGQVFFVRLCDKARSRLSPAYKKTKAYRDMHVD